MPSNNSGDNTSSSSSSSAPASTTTTTTTATPGDADVARDPYDSYASKTALDDVLCAFIDDARCEYDYRYSNFRLAMNALICVLAYYTHFFPVPWPHSRPYILICIIVYHILSGICLYCTFYVEKDAIFWTNKSDRCTLPVARSDIVVSTVLSRYSDEFTMTIEARTNDCAPVSLTRSIGEYMTARGEIAESVVTGDFLSLWKQLGSGKRESKKEKRK